MTEAEEKFPGVTAALAAARKGAVQITLQKGNDAWADELAEVHIEMNSRRMCILGRLYGSYEDGLAVLMSKSSYKDPSDTFSGITEEAHEFAKQNGFVANCHRSPEMPLTSECREKFTDLTTAWYIVIADIRDRRAG